MDTSFASTRGEIFTFTSDRRSLLSTQKLVATLPTFLTDCLLRTDSDAAVKLFPHDWIGVVTDGNLFLWRFTHSKDNTVGITSSCRQFELPSNQRASATAVSVSCFENDGRPRLCAAVASDVLRVWPRGVFGAVGNSQVVYDCIDTRLNGLKSGESCVALEEGPCAGTFLLATSQGRVFGVDARTPQEQVVFFLVIEGVTNLQSVGSNAVNTSVQYQMNMSENLANTSLLSGLGRRVSSIWSFATSRVPVLNVSSLVSLGGLSATGKVLRFLTVATSQNTSRMFLLTQSRLIVWDLDADFEYTLLLCLDLNNDTYGEAIDTTLFSTSTPSNLWLLCKSVEEEDALSLILLDVESASLGNEKSISRVSVVVDTSVTDFQVVASITEPSVYPCTLLALFSTEFGVVYITEALTGRCICQLEFEQPSSLLGLISAPNDSGALFALVTRQRGIYGVVGEDPCLPSLACFQLTVDCLSDPDQLLEALTKIAAVLWMGYEDEAGVLINALFGQPNRVKSDVLLTAFLRLVKCILNSRPTSGLDARWRGVTANNSVISFDFARGCGDSRFVAKQEGMRCLGGRLWPAIESVAPKISGATDAASLFAEVFPPLLSSMVGASGSRYHVLNIFLAGAEVCEIARVLHSRWCR
ncbi:unnamed protein product [Hymenolepis diminuta]|nr:unnamed protein product [Hymenolepis diminuta]